MGISCDMSIWSNPEELGSNEARHRFDQSLPCRIPDRFRNASSSPHGVSPVALRLLAFQDSFSPDGNDALMFEEKRVSRALATKEVSYPEDCVKSCNSLPANLDAMEASYPKRSNSFPANLACMVNRPGPTTSDFYNSDAFKLLISFGAQSSSFTSFRSGLALMVNIYGSVSLMAKDQIGCRALQKLVKEGTFHDFKSLFGGIINHVIDVSMDQFRN
ncbi:unnamed protein product [Brassica oleracea var. botrytis]|uniref:Uncharacterized protein n=1 Tax=Brassica oleracea var. oleracea TaxID=109376 RepID=A0A0D3DKI4_BRAOL